MFLLRSKTLRGIETNFTKQYSSILCPLCETYEDTQEHILMCKVLQNILHLSIHMSYMHMRGTTGEQTEFQHTYEKYLMICEESFNSTGINISLPGIHTGPVLP